MNTLALLFALAFVAQDENAPVPAIRECATPERDCCSRPEEPTCCRRFLGRLIGHRCRAQKETRYKKVMEVILSDPGNWFVHRMGTAPGTYWYQVDHSSAGGSGINPAACGPYATIEEAADAILCLQSDMNPSTTTCHPCSPSPIYPGPTVQWWTFRYGSGFSSYYYRIKHDTLSSAKRCPPKATPDIGYANNQLIKALDAMTAFQAGTPAHPACCPIAP
jgi:hypothetical protein